jgi:hypothetical protein
VKYKEYKKKRGKEIKKMVEKNDNNKRKREK